jgi:hypothetical protein
MRLVFPPFCGLVRTLKSRRETIACNGASGRVGFEINASPAGPLMHAHEGRADGMQPLCRTTAV